MLHLSQGSSSSWIWSDCCSPFLLTPNKIARSPSLQAFLQVQGGQGSRKQHEAAHECEESATFGCRSTVSALTDYIVLLCMATSQSRSQSPRKRLQQKRVTPFHHCHAHAIWNEQHLRAQCQSRLPTRLRFENSTTLRARLRLGGAFWQPRMEKQGLCRDRCSKPTENFVAEPCMAEVWAASCTDFQDRVAKLDPDRHIQTRRSRAPQRVTRTSRPRRSLLPLPRAPSNA